MKVRNGARPRISNLCALALLPLFVLAGATRTEAQTKAYVADTAANVVTVIDTATRTAVGTVTVGTHPADAAITRDGTRVYVTNGGDDSISVIDTVSDAVIDTIPVGHSPSALAVTPDGSTLYVMTDGGVVDVVDTALHTIAATISVGSSGDIAMTPDGRRVYVAAGLLYIIDTATNAIVRSFPAEAAPIPDVTHTASSVTIAPDGSRAYVGVVTFNFTGGNFSGGGNVVLVDTASEAVTGTINLFTALPASIALTPDGSRAYVGIQSHWVNTGYGAGFFNGREIYVIDTITNTIPALIDLGADGPNWTQQNTAAGIGVTPDRSAVYAAIHRLGVVAVADVNTNAVTSLIPVTSFPSALAIVPATVALVPYLIDAVDDSGTVTSVGATAVANVLENDRLGGIRVTTAHVTLAQQSSTSGGVSLDPATGAVNVARGTEVGIQTLVYRICEIAAPSNCDQATVTVTVLPPYVIDAVNDSASTLPGRTVLASVLANDTLGGTPATTARVRLSVVSSTSAGLTLDTATGSVYVAVGTAGGTQTLTYRICEIVDLSNCDTADVTITVIPFFIDAVDDSGSAPRTGGTAVANVLANDRFTNVAATLATVRLTQLSSTNAGVSLNVANGAVTVAAGTAVGTHTLRYSICEIAAPSNCDEAIVTVTVRHLLIIAANDNASGSSKVANTVLASVLTNDRLEGAPATLANVRLSFVSLTPANSQIRLDLTDGSVDVLGKTSSGLYSLVYEICEAAMPVNCARGTVGINLSGK